MTLSTRGIDSAKLKFDVCRINSKAKLTHSLPEHA